jgi:hypothetical protein
MVETSKGGVTYYYLFFVPHHFWLILFLPKSMDGYFSVMFFLGVVHAHTLLGGGFWGHHLVLCFFISLEYAIADYIV